MKKVLFLIGSLEGGGAERVLIDIVNALPKDEFDITVMTIYNKKTYSTPLKDYIKYLSITSEKINFVDKMKAIAVHKVPFNKLLHKLFIRQKYDIEIAFLEGVTAKLISGSNKNTKKIAWIHNNLERFPDSITFLGGPKRAKRIYDKFNHIVCVSNSAKKEFCKLLNIKLEKVSVQYNPINVDAIKQYQRRNNENDRFTFVTVGRLAKAKGYERLIYAVEKLRKKYDFQVQILGTGKLEDELRTLIENKNLKEYIQLLGFVDNPYEVVAQADAFVCSSEVEGYPLAVCEALVLQVPCIVTECGAEEVVEDGLYGMVVENSLMGICYGMERVLSDMQFFKELKEKSIQGSKKFDFNDTIEKIKNEILDIE